MKTWTNPKITVPVLFLAGVLALVNLAVMFFNQTQHTGNNRDSSESNYLSLFSSLGIGRIYPKTVLFTTFKEQELERMSIHSCVIKNWANLKPYVHPVLFTTLQSEALAALAAKYGWDVFTVPASNKFGTPYIKEMFLTVYGKYDAHFYGYANGDLLFSRSFVETMRALHDEFQKGTNTNLQPFIVGRRMNYEVDTEVPEDLWHPDQVDKHWNQNHLYRGDAIDYMLTQRNQYPWSGALDLVIGRIGFDQYLLNRAIRQNLSVVATSRTNHVLHLQGKNASLTHHSDTSPDKLYNIHLIRADGGMAWTESFIGNGAWSTQPSHGRVRVVFNKDWSAEDKRVKLEQLRAAKKLKSKREKQALSTPVAHHSKPKTTVLTRMQNKNSTPSVLKKKANKMKVVKKT